MSLNINALNTFSNANLGGDDAIVNLGEGNAIAKKNNYHGSLGKIFRAGSTKAANNAVRAELLRSLGNTFGFSGMSEANGKATFSTRRVGVREGVVCEDLHAKALADAGEDASNLSRSDDARSLSVQVEAGETGKREVEIARSRGGAVDVAVQ